MPYDSLLKHLGYRFSDETLLERALTHRSCGSNNNERLEFLGDSLLNCIIAEALFQRFPDTPEGDLSRMRSTLVRGKTLAAIGADFALGDHLLLGPGEMKSGGHRRESILADAVEALIGAIYLDSDFLCCRERVLQWFESRLATVSVEGSKDAKTRLQEYLQGRGQPLPVYSVVSTHGEGHQQQFEVQCSVALLKQPLHATGESRKKAEQQAAAMALQALEVVK